MPIEIRELVIKATVTQEGAPATGGRPAASNNATTTSEEIINTCVERVLEIIRDKIER
jgi:Family of unknown function (DUF5908)